MDSQLKMKIEQELQEMDSKAPTVSRIADLKPKLSRKVKKKKSTTTSDHTKIQQ